MAEVDHLLFARVRGVWRWAPMLLLGLASCGSEKLKSSVGDGGGSPGGSARNTGGASGSAGKTSSGGGKGGAASGVGGNAHAGAAGTSSGIDPDFDVPESEWQEVATFSSCRLRVARDPRRVWAGLVFSETEPGIATAELAVGSRSLLGAVLGTAARREGEQSLISTSLRWPNKRRFLLTSVDVNLGVPRVVSSVEGNCYGQLAGERSPQLFANYDLSGANATQYGWLSPEGPFSIAWLSSAPLTLLNAFDTGQRWGGIVDFSSILITDAPDLPELHQAYRSSALMRTPVGRRGAVYWTEGEPEHGAVMVLQPGDEASVVAQFDYYPANVGVSDERVVWLGVEGARVVDGSYDRAHLDGCSGFLTGECSPRRIADLPITSSTGVLVVDGPWVALTGCVETGCAAHVIDLETFEVYRLRTPVDLARVRPIALDAGVLYAIGFGATTLGTADFERFVRFDLSQLSRIGERL